MEAGFHGADGDALLGGNALKRHLVEMVEHHDAAPGLRQRSQSPFQRRGVLRGAQTRGGARSRIEDVVRLKNVAPHAPASMPIHEVAMHDGHKPGSHGGRAPRIKPGQRAKQLLPGFLPRVLRLRVESPAQCPYEAAVFGDEALGFGEGEAQGGHGGYTRTKSGRVPTRYPTRMPAPTLAQILDMLVVDRLLHAGQKQDVLNRGKEQARHLLLDRRAELRRLLGRQRVSYSVSELELIASFRFKRLDAPDVLLDEETITEVVARHLGHGFIRIDPLKLDFRLVVEAFGGPFAEKNLVVAVEDKPQLMTVALTDPWNTVLLQQLAEFKGKPIRPVMAPKSEIMRVITEFHGFRRSMRAAEVELANNLPDIANLEALYRVSGMNELEANDQPVVQAVWYLLNYAYDQRASDIHIEPKREDALVRMRIDGVLHVVHRMPRTVHPAVVSRIKLLARLDIAEKRRPQDGRFKTEIGKDEVELRVSTVPTAFGEKVVIRVFDPAVLKQSLTDLGFFPRELTLYENMIRRPNGMVLITGPTGSGKTTTLYSTLNHIASPRVNICTLEDPIEMVQEQFNQMAMQPKIGFTFGTALKNVLRQDPDVVMVGEIRDPDTAENAVQAALTGHLVLSTVHTNDAASAVSRLLDLGVFPFLVSGVLTGVVAQRLVRKICVGCAADEALTNEQIDALNIRGAEGRQLRVKRGRGCVRCRGTGYRGRTGVFEVLPITPRVRTLIQSRASSQDIKREALNDGMLTLREYAIKKMARGETTFEEILAVTEEAALY